MVAWRAHMDDQAEEDLHHEDASSIDSVDSTPTGSVDSGHSTASISSKQDPCKTHLCRRCGSQRAPCYIEGCIMNLGYEAGHTRPYSLPWKRRCQGCPTGGTSMPPYACSLRTTGRWTTMTFFLSFYKLIGIMLLAHASCRSHSFGTMNGLMDSAEPSTAAAYINCMLVFPHKSHATSVSP